MAGIHFRDFAAADDNAALALERRCPQGQAFRIAFRRDRFAARTEAFSTARLICAWDAGRLAGVGGGAIKDVIWEGRQTRALMLYDFRIDPDYRREGIARSLALMLIDWARPLAEIGYAYALGDNRAIREMARQWIGAGAAPAISLLAHPTHRPAPTDVCIIDADPLEVRNRYVRTRGEAAFACPPDPALTGRQVAGSWQLAGGKAGGCTAWSTRGLLEEVVIGLPPTIRAAGRVLRTPLLRHLPLPHVPAIGEALRSWLVIDAHAPDPEAARTMLRAVAAKARTSGIDYCHVLAVPGTPWLDAVRRSLPRLFAPAIPFTILARTLDGRPLQLAAPIVDPRDL